MNMLADSSVLRAPLDPLVALSRLKTPRAPLVEPLTGQQSQGQDPGFRTRYTESQQDALLFLAVRGFI